MTFIFVDGPVTTPLVFLALFLGVPSLVVWLLLRKW